MLIIAALVTVYVRRHTALPTDTLVGVFLSMALGLGICLLVAVMKRFNIHQVEAVMFGSLLTGILMFAVLYLLARWATATDPQILRILLNSSKFKTHYDPAKREDFAVEGSRRVG